MKILIIDDDMIGSSKLKLVFSKYGECDIASNGNEAIDMYVKSHDSSEPYGFITVEMEMQEMLGTEIREEIRKWESENEKEKAKILLIISENDQEEVTDLIHDESTTFLIKPYNRKKLDTLLANMGLEKVEEKPQKAKAPKAVDAEKVEAIKNKITAIITKVDAGQMADIDVAKILEELVYEGGEEAELLLGQYISSEKLSMEIRQELIRSAGLIKSPHFMIPLNKVINSETNIKMIQAAFLAVGKYNNQLALNVLNQGLQKFKHPQLLNLLRAEIDKIKKNKPVLAILPRFLHSYKNLKNFRVTIDIIKKIITPEDNEIFINYLKSGNTPIADGTFEILCFTGELSLKTTIFNYFEDRIHKIACLQQPECTELYSILSQLAIYLQRNPQLIDELIREFKELFPTIKDSSSKSLIISLLSQSQRPEALEFIKIIYNQEEGLQGHIIDQLSGNQQAVDFLFEKYHQGQVLKEKVITSLLKSEQGLKYFIQHFFTFELDKQEIILKNITFSRQEFLMEFIEKIYQSQLYILKFHLLKVLKENYLFSFKEVLFDEDNQREFMFMGKDYLETIIHLFPLSSLKMFYEKISAEDLSNIKVKKYLTWVTEIGKLEPVLQFRDVKLINQLFTRIINANNIDLNVHFFSSLENIRVLDLPSYRNLLEATTKFVEIRATNITEKEKIAISRVKKNLRDQLPEIRDIEQLQKEINMVFANKPIDRERLEKLIENNHTAAAIKVHHLLAYLCSKFKDPTIIKKEDQELFFVKFPLLAEMMKLLWEGQINLAENWIEIASRKELLKHFQDRLRVVLTFESKRISAFIKDQLEESYPEIKVVLDLENDQLKKTDIVVCDTESLKKYVEGATFRYRSIYLYLENRMDFAQFRDLNPKAFMKPLSGYRVIRLLLQDLFL